MKIYVASKFEYFDQVREVIRALEEEGHEITYDWTKHADLSPEEKNDLERLRMCACEDLAGVQTCDLLFLLAHHPNLAGAWVEMGVALGLGKRVIVVSPVRDCIFLHLTEVYSSVIEAIEAI